MLNFSVAVKSALASFSYSIGLVSWGIRRNPTSSSVVLMYHHVMPAEKAKRRVQAGMYVKPETFENHLLFLQRYFRIVSLSELYSNSKASLHQVDHSKPLCILTFDDGWRDFYEHAFPILKNYWVPATVFLPTDFIGTEHCFWTDRLAHLLFQEEDKIASVTRDKVSLHPLVKRLELLKGSRELQLERAIEILKAYRDDEIEKVLLDLAVKWNIKSDLPNRSFVTWEEVREMAQSGLISYGSHTASHKILTTLSDKEVQDELVRSRRKLIAENVVDPLFIPFSYPNGGYNEKVVRMVRDSGYNLSVTTQNGWNFSRSDPYLLRRVSIHEDMTSSNAMFGCRLMGTL